MSEIIDKKFINLVSGALNLFKWKKETLANCRCPLCGDSQSNKTKCRGYFFPYKGKWIYKCHNCGEAHGIYNFLKLVAPNLAKQYSMESFAEKKGMIRKPASPDNIAKKAKPVFASGDHCLKTLVRCDRLSSDHFCREFLELRRIPSKFYDLLYFSEDFGQFMKMADPEGIPVGREPRLVIPFFNKKGDMVAAQGRALNLTDEYHARTTAKYLTIKADKSIDRLWYGLWRVNPKKKVYIVEGPLDSLFIPNTVALVGAGAITDVHPHIANSDYVYCLDNEPRNKQIVRYNEMLIEHGKQVCIWPEWMQHKDINDMVGEYSPKKIRRIIDNHTYTGLEARLAFREWRRV